MKCMLQMKTTSEFDISVRADMFVKLIVESFLGVNPTQTVRFLIFFQFKMPCSVGATLFVGLPNKTKVKVWLDNFRLFNRTYIRFCVWICILVNSQFCVLCCLFGLTTYLECSEHKLCFI